MQKILRIVLGAMILTLGPFALAQDIPAVRINEIMFNPLSGGEWIELFSADTGEINCRGWFLVDENDTCYLEPQKDIRLRSNSFLLVAQDSLELKKAYPWAEKNMLDPFNWIVLNNDGDCIVLKNNLGQTVDSLCFDPALWFQSAFPQGKSIERRDPLAATGLASNWAISKNPNGGTPGFASSVSPAPETVFHVEAGPKLFHPKQGEFLTIIADLPFYGKLEVLIYNLSGLLEKSVFSGYTSEKETVCWDGKNNAGKRVKNGPYILLIQFEGPNKKTDKFKQSIVVAP